MLWAVLCLLVALYAHRLVALSARLPGLPGSFPTERHKSRLVGLVLLSAAFLAASGSFSHTRESSGV